MLGRKPPNVRPRWASQGTGVNGPSKPKASRNDKMMWRHSWFCSIWKDFPNTKSPMTSKLSQLKIVLTAIDLFAATSVAICSSTVSRCFNALSLYRSTAAIKYQFHFASCAFIRTLGRKTTIPYPAPLVMCPGITGCDQGHDRVRDVVPLGFDTYVSRPINCLIDVRMGDGYLTRSFTALARTEMLLTACNSTCPSVPDLRCPG